MTNKPDIVHHCGHCAGEIHTRKFLAGYLLLLFVAVPCARHPGARLGWWVCVRGSVTCHSAGRPQGNLLPKKRRGLQLQQLICGHCFPVTWVISSPTEVPSRLFESFILEQ